MAYHFKNLVFEGGGVKGIAYLGALQALSSREILPQVSRVGGTSAGAIHAALVALGYSLEEQSEIVQAMDFNKFMDSGFGIIMDTLRLIRHFGWYKGDYFHNWMRELVARKLGHPDATFQDLKQRGLRDLYVIGANLSTGLAEVFSHEQTPHMPIAHAVRISMSIPLFFRCVRGANRDVYVDGGILDNYPVKLFDRLKYIAESERESHARPTEYYEQINRRREDLISDFSPFVYNRETLGFRLDSTAEIATFRDHKDPEHKKIKSLKAYTAALIGTLLDVQSHQHLHSDDWQRTIYIDTLGIETVQFQISDELKNGLIDSGKKFTESYFTWYDTADQEAANKPTDTSPKVQIARPS
ncbi:MAG: patatin-like phospholipase family protein [Bdellovibrionaceae bacterium]|nr:patatin-like phospholipase family protein [Pseudobdellovibrionaceae bacterium]